MGGSSCPESLASISRQIRKTQFWLGMYGPHELQFDRGQPNPELKGRIEAALAPVARFDGGAFASYELDCRGWVCRIDVTVGEAGAARFGELRRLLHSLPGREAVSFGRVIHIKMAEPDTADGIGLLRGLMDEYRASGAIAACGARHGGEGTLEVILDVGGFDQEEGTISLRFSGDLVGTPAGTCLEESLRTAARALDVPDLVVPSRTGFTMRLPVKERG